MIEISCDLSHLAVRPRSRCSAAATPMLMLIKMHVCLPRTIADKVARPRLSDVVGGEG